MIVIFKQHTNKCVNSVVKYQFNYLQRIISTWLSKPLYGSTLHGYFPDAQPCRCVAVSELTCRANNVNTFYVTLNNSASIHNGLEKKDCNFPFHRSRNT